MSDRIATLNKIRENFIISRTHYEQEVNAWLRYLGTLPTDVYERITSNTIFTKDKTCKDIIPEWWATEPNKDVVHEQVRIANENFEKADAIFLEIMEEGLKASNDFNRAMNGGS